MKKTLVFQTVFDSKAMTNEKPRRKSKHIALLSPLVRVTSGWLGVVKGWLGSVRV